MLPAPPRPDACYKTGRRELRVEEAVMGDAM